MWLLMGPVEPVKRMGLAHSLSCPLCLAFISSPWLSSLHVPVPHGPAQIPSWRVSSPQISTHCGLPSECMYTCLWYQDLNFACDVLRKQPSCYLKVKLWPRKLNSPQRLLQQRGLTHHHGLNKIKLFLSELSTVRSWGITSLHPMLNGGLDV